MAQQMDLTAAFEPILRWLSHHVNPQRFYLLLGVVLFLVAWNRGIALLYGIVSLLVALLVVSYLLPPLNVRHLTMKMPKHLQCRAGDELEINLQLFSRSACQHISVTMDDTVPGHENSKPAFVPYLNGDANARLMLICNQRGDYTVHQLVLTSSFPFGIHTAQRNIDCSLCRLLVYPKTFRIAALPRCSARSLAIHGQQLISHSHSDEEYAGVREYRHGDNLKHIHWGASAKHRELIVREFESYDRPAMLIILNCNQQDEFGNAPDSCFEYSIEIAASLMLYASRHGIAVELFAEGKQGFHLSMSPGDASMDYHYRQFAQMKANGNRDYCQQVASLCSRFHHIDTVVTFYPQRASGPLSLHNKNHIDIRFDQDSFVERRLNTSRSVPVVSGNRVSYTVRWGNPLENVFDAAD